MNRKVCSALTLGAALVTQTALVSGADRSELSLTLLEDRPAEKGFSRIFNGKDLTGWEGNPKLWSLKDGAITATITQAPSCTVNQYLVWREPTDDIEPGLHLHGDPPVTVQFKDIRMKRLTEGTH